MALLRRAIKAVGTQASVAASFSRLQSTVTRAAVLHKPYDLRMEDIDVPEPLHPRDVRIDIYSVGICGSDVEYYKHGAIGPFKMKQPMILGHEAAGVVTEVGAEVKNLKVGDRVCMEPGVPSPHGKATRLGMYNVDQQLRFWATPPPAYATDLHNDAAWKNGHGCLRPSVVHPEDFTFRVPGNVSLDEAAMVEPLAVGMHACTKAGIRPGDVAVITGAGPIGMLATMAALASGCSRVYVSDINSNKLKVAESLAPSGTIIGVDIRKDKDALTKRIAEDTNGWGVNVLLECSGHYSAYHNLHEVIAPGGQAVLVGCPGEVKVDIGNFQAKEITLKSVFRYAHVYPQAVALLGSGRINVKPIITNHFEFDQSPEAFEYSLNPDEHTIKSIIHVKHE